MVSDTNPFPTWSRMRAVAPLLFHGWASHLPLGKRNSNFPLCGMGIKEWRNERVAPLPPIHNNSMIGHSLVQPIFQEEVGR